MSTAVVIGAGVGGLTAALALRARGWDVTVYERAAALEKIGAGLAVAPNALRLLDRLGVGERIRALAALQGDAGIMRPDGSWLSRTSAEAAQARFGDPVVMLRRAELVAALSDALIEAAGPATVRFGSVVSDVDAAAGTVTVGGEAAGAEAAGAEVAAPETVTADLVVAADGINSAVRARLFPDHPGVRYSGVTSWRLLAPAPSVPVVPGERWGRGTIVGLAPLADGTVYAYATAVAPPNHAAGGGTGSGGTGSGGTEAERAELLRHFGDWQAPIPELVASAGEILRTDIRCLAAPLPRFHEGRVALLGDAAHAMTPHLGQGACQAIEDAYILASVAGGPDGLARDDLARDGLARDGLARYTAARLGRTTDIARRSWSICRLTRLRHPVPVAVRDGALWLSSKFGQGAILRQMEPVLGWRPE